MMRWKPNITICDTLAGKCCSPRFQNVCDVRPWQGTAVGPSHAQHFEKRKKEKKGPMQRPTEQRSGSPLRQTMLARWVTFGGFGFGLAEVKSLMTVHTAVFVCA